MRGFFSRPKSRNGNYFLVFFSFLLLSVLFIFLSSFPGYCAQVTLTWDPNSESDLDGYKIYFGVQSGNYQWNIDAGNVSSYTLTGLNLGMTYYAAATAYNTSGYESGYSNEVSFFTGSCTYTLSSSSASFPISGGSGGVSVTTQAGCNWGTSASIPWLTVTSGSVMGSGTMSYTVSPNTGAIRTASLTIAGNVFTVTESGITTYRITASAGAGGAISPSGGISIQSGANQTFAITPNSGYQIVNVTVDGVSQGAIASYTFSSVSANHLLTATFSAFINTPVVTTGSAGSVTLNSAILNGTINPNGFSTTYVFEWGTTASYGNTTAVLSAGNGTSNVAAQANLTGLTANTLYHYRLVATNSAGSSNGTDGTFIAQPVNKVDFNNDWKTDLLWIHNQTGEIGVWFMNGVTPTGKAMIAPGNDINWEMKGTGDFNGDGKTDILWRNKASGQVYIWLLSGVTLIAQNSPGTADLGWEIKGVGDFSGDGKADILWRNKASGQVYIWLMNGYTIASQGSPAPFSDLNWEIKDVGDFNKDGKADILWRHVLTGQVYIWLMNGIAIESQGSPGTAIDLNWEIKGVGDFDGDGKTDILWRHASSGQVYLWLMNGTTIASIGSPGIESDLNWQIKGVGDFNGDWKADIVWRHTTKGLLYIWLINGTTLLSMGSPGTVNDGNWTMIIP